MKKQITLFLGLFIAIMASAQTSVLNSPDGSLTLSVGLSVKGSLTYQVQKNKKMIIGTSAMGLTGDVDFAQDLKIISTKKVAKQSDSYHTFAEKRTFRSYVFNAMSLTLENKDRKRMIVECKATNEGVAFRYLIVSPSPLAVKEELTTFAFAPSTKAWLHPHANVKDGWAQTQPSYEEQYEYDIPVGTAAPQKAGWSFPALFKTENGWVLLTEAGLTADYAGTRLAQQSPNGVYSIGFPQKGETTHPEDAAYPISSNITSSWRVIVVGSLATVVESQMVSDLAPAADKKIDYSWVKPGISSWSWGVLHDDATVFPVQQKFIDYAAEMHWDYCLVDADWDRKIGYDKIQELVNQAKAKKVGVLLWYNSSGAWNTTVYSPKGALLEREARRKEFEKIHRMGVAGVKVDFWPGDGQSAIQYYLDVLKDAADFHLLVNFHGATVPRGWSRTYPNLVAMESIRGFEFTTFDQKDTDMAPKHLTMMCFARNVVGPMDFTPVCFGEIPGKIRRTSNGMELALTVILQAGVQHYVEIPESMAKQPDFVREYLRTVPRSWTDLKLLDGFPGKYAVIARKSGDHWYVAGINSQAEVASITLDLSKLKLSAPKKAYTVITDGANNRSFVQKDIPVQGQQLKVAIQPNGGFVVVL